MFGDVAAERHIVAVETQRREIRGDEIRSVRRQHVEPDLGEAGGHLIAPRLQIRRQRGEIRVVLAQSDGDRALQVGRGGEGQVLMRLLHQRRQVRRRR